MAKIELRTWRCGECGLHTTHKGTGEHCGEPMEALPWKCARCGARECRDPYTLCAGCRARLRAAWG